MTLTIEIEPGRWESMMSERTPQVMDDVVKSARHLSLDQMCDTLDVNAVFRWLPMCFPQGFEVKDHWTQKAIYSVAQYPVEQWRKSGRPYMSMNSWFKLLMLLGDGRPELAELVEVAQCLEDSTSDQHKYNLKNLRKWQYRRVQEGSWTQIL